LGRTSLLHAVGTAALLLLLVANAEAYCPPRHEVALADGAKVCLTDYPLAQASAARSFGSVASLIPFSGFYHLAVPRRPGACPPAVGLQVPRGPATGMNAGVDPRNKPEARAEASRNACQAAAGDSAPGGNCECIVIVADGTSTLNRQEFERLAQEVGSPGPKAP
jgi:hypothetical protein